MYSKLVPTLLCCLVIAGAGAEGAEKKTKAKTRPARATFVGTTDLVKVPERPQLPTFPPAANEPGPDYHHASTVAQGYLDGLARVLRAEGSRLTTMRSPRW